VWIPKHCQNWAHGTIIFRMWHVQIIIIIIIINECIFLGSISLVINPNDDFNSICY